MSCVSKYRAAQCPALVLKANHVQPSGCRMWLSRPLVERCLTLIWCSQSLPLPHRAVPGWQSRRLLLPPGQGVLGCSCSAQISCWELTTHHCPAGTLIYSQMFPGAATDDISARGKITLFHAKALETRSNRK